MYCDRRDHRWDDVWSRFVIYDREGEQERKRREKGPKGARTGCIKNPVGKKATSPAVRIYFYGTEKHDPGEAGVWQYSGCWLWYVS